MEASPSAANLAEAAPFNPALWRSRHYSAWARVLALRDPWRGAASKLVEELIWRHWEAFYFFFRFKQYNQQKTIRTLLKLPFWMSFQIHSRPELWMFRERMREYLFVVVQFSHPHMAFMANSLTAEDAKTLLMAPMFDHLETLLPEVLASNDLASGFLCMWRISVVSRCQAVLEREWMAIGEKEFYREAIESVPQSPTECARRKIACTLGQSEEEIDMALSRLRRRYDEVLREFVRDTAATPPACAEEWTELFGEQERVR